MGIDTGKNAKKSGGGGGKRKRQGNKKASATAPAVEQARSSIRAQTNALLNLASFSNPNPKTLGPFSDRHRTLVVGDGDLSFSLSLAVYFGGRNVTATCFDSKSELREKYNTALMNADALETAGTEVYYDVDATALEKEAWIHDVERFNNIAFNFPHLGGATEADVANNQQLLRNFFYSTRAFLHPTHGQVLVALRDTPFYNRWAIEDQAKISGFKLKRVEVFDGSIYSGYQAQRTHPASFRGEPPSTTGARYFIFVKDPTIHPEDPRSSTSGSATGEMGLGAFKKNTKVPGKGKAKQADAASPASLNCKVCGIAFRDSKKFNGHLNSAKHSRKVKQLQKKNWYPHSSSFEKLIKKNPGKSVMLALLRRGSSLRSTTHSSLKTMTSRAALSTATVAHSPLLSTDELATLLAQQPDTVKLVDGSWYLDKDRNGRHEFAQERLPNARFFDIAEIADKTSTLPHMLPTVETFETAMKYLGIANDDTVVVYGGPNCFSAARCWWTFKFFGHEKVHILNGGLAKWKKEQREIVSGAPDAAVSTAVSYKADPQHDLVVSWEQVLAKLNSETQIADARGPGRFNGTDAEPRPGMRSGHMPSAVNVPFAKLVTKDDYSVFRNLDQIQQAFTDAHVKMDETSPVITSCGSGVTACVLTFGLHLLGKPLNKAPVYDGSWSEWGLRNDLPVETSK